ncbi:MAG: protein-disulfide reductase DsbD [Sulfurimicrobium sp.]|jgi:thiol:disulfide interchange protein DsbD|nr:protein-disulfide reductase DsbD [Sulfurimicrobium sp.]
MMRFIISMLLMLHILGAHAEEGDLLEPEQAFRFSAKVLDANNIEVRYQIANGYYLYREKFKFSIEPAGVTLGTGQFPAGKIKQDEYFGKVETYRQNLVIKLPLTRTASSAQNITLKAVSQGCADVGVCYPPTTQTIKLTLPAAAADPPPQASSGGLAALTALIKGGAQDELLEPDQAFKLALTARDAQTLVADFTPAEGYYLYRDRIKFVLKDAEGVSIAKIELPKGETKTDPSFGATEVYHHPFQALVHLQGAAGKLTLQATYQGCSEKGVCYPPQNKTFTLDLPASMPSGTPETKPASAPEAAPAPASANGDASESSQIETLLKGGNFWLVIASFFGFGLLLALTPCVFPMIPILSGIIVGQGQHLTRPRAFALSLAYVLGMAITYAAAGVAAGLSGTLLTSALQNPWVLGTFALVFVALAFSMFGFYELQMPNFIQSRFNDASNKMKGGKLTGVFAMGALSAVIVGPCVAAPLAGALAYIGLTRDVWLGGWALFAMALGMGAPLLAIGLSAGALLPRAGGWMEAVKAFFGVLLLGVAIWLISPVIPAVVHMLLWAALLIVSAIYLRALDPLPHPSKGWAKFWKGVGVVALIAGVALLIGALSGGRDVLQPLSGLRGAGTAVAAESGHVRFEKVKSVAELDQRIQQAQGKFVMLDFYADWCVSCKELERFTFSDARVQARLGDMILLQADVTANSDEDKALLKKFGLFGPPGIIFFDPSGKEKNRLVGYENPDKFLARAESVLK